MGGREKCSFWLGIYKGQCEVGGRDRMFLKVGNYIPPGWSCPMLLVTVRNLQHRTKEHRCGRAGVDIGQCEVGEVGREGGREEGRQGGYITI